LALFQSLKHAVTNFVKIFIPKATYLRYVFFYTAMYGKFLGLRPHNCEYFRFIVLYFSLVVL
jgi:hypothetical protein